MTNLTALVESLHPHEVKVLTALGAGSDLTLTEEDLAKQTSLEAAQAGAALGRLQLKRLVEMRDEATSEIVSLTEIGERYLHQGSPLARIIGALRVAREEGASLTIKDIQNREGLEAGDISGIIGALKQEGAILIAAGGVVKLSETESRTAKALQDTIAKVKRTGARELRTYDVDEQALIQKFAQKRGNPNEPFRVDTRIVRKFGLTELGRTVADQIVTAGVREEVAQLTHEMLKDGSWRDVRFRKYTIGLTPARRSIGKKHPYREFLDLVKAKFVGMGFEEMRGPLVENEFWDMDALYMPQFHPARNIHDVYFVKEPTHSAPLPEPFLKQVKQAHEHGWKTGSTGWGYAFDPMRARRLVLRSQGTAVSARTLARKPKVPGKYFSIARCFRYDQVDATHAPDFYQIEGIVLGADINFRTLLGLLELFAREIAQAQESKFLPAYFPFTEPSVELHVRHPRLGWMELGGAGLFRPEVTKPLGVDVPVIAWGLGLDRMAMVALEIHDIRDLFSPDLEMIRSKRVQYYGPAIMPTISISRSDLERLIGRRASDKDLEGWLPLVKGELKDIDTTIGELRIELQDSNRPDLWCVEGIARQIRCKLKGAPPTYGYLKASKGRRDQVLVQKGLERVRPFVAACKAFGYGVSDEGLAHLIQTQEKLAEIFGRRRRTVSIGIYRLSAITFPVTYALVDPERTWFCPLGIDEPITLQEILEVHPKGVEYRSILEGQDQFPLLRDAQEQILSFPPIINSRDIGEVRPGDRDLFVEVTGTDLRMVMLALNIFAANLHDRGATIEPVDVVYPYKTEFGRNIRMPRHFTAPRKIKRREIATALGAELSLRDIRQSLVSYGYTVKGTANTFSVTLPAYRNDLMHPVDVIEDVAISRGYGTFSPVMPSAFTVGGLARIEQLSDKVRELMVGFGFQEMVSNILTSREDLLQKMRLTAGDAGGRIVEIENVMSLSGEVLRQWILPSLLRVEATSSRSFYPHFIFEVGEVAVPDTAAEVGSRTEVRLGALNAHADATFSEGHSFLELLAFYLNKPYRLEPVSHPSFLEGRAAEIVFGDRPIGLIGELHPEVLERWQITMPCSAFELALNPLL